MEASFEAFRKFVTRLTVDKKESGTGQMARVCTYKHDLLKMVTIISTTMMMMNQGKR